MEHKYIIYCRKSSEDDKNQILSIQSQTEELEQYVDNNNLKVASYFPESHSAAKTGRPVFDLVLREIEAGRANALLVWKFDRISRNETDTARVIKLFRDGLLEEIRTPFETYRKGDNVLLLYIYFGMADEYSRQLSANVKRGLRTKLRLGQFPSNAPFGYKNYNRNEIRNIEPDENAPIVKMIFKLYASGELSLSQIKEKLNNDLKVFSERKRNFSKSELQRILDNKTYYGVIERDGELFPGTYQPIITKELYDKAQSVRNNKSRPRSKKFLHAYKMLVRCSKCSSTYTGSTIHKFYPKTNRHAYYTYYNCAKKHGKCSQMPIKESELESQLIKAITRVEFDKEEWNIARALFKLDLDKANSFEFDLKNKYNTEIKKLKSMSTTLLDLRTTKEIAADEYVEKKNEYTDKIKCYEGKLSELNPVFEDKFKLVENFAEVILRAQEILESDDIVRKRQLAMSISSNYFILDGKLEISFKKPFSFFFKQQKPLSPIHWRGGRDSNPRPLP